MPMFSLPPGMFSIRTLWPQASVSFCATMRALTSFGPPAATGTMMRTGRAGYDCAKAPGGGERQSGAGELKKLSAGEFHGVSCSFRVF